MAILHRIYDRFRKSDITQADRKTLITGTIHSFVIQGISVLLVFAGNYLLIQLFGAANYGLYVHIFNWVSILSIVALGGQEDVVLSRIPKYKATGKQPQIGSIIRYSNIRVAVTSILVSAIFLLLINIFPIPTLSGHKTEFLIASAAVALSAFITLNQMVLQALNHIRLSQLTERLVKPLLLIVFIGLIQLFGYPVNAQVLLIIAVVILVLCALVAGYLVRNKAKAYFRGITEKYHASGVSKQTLYFLSISLLQLLTGKIGMLILPYFTVQQDIGIYNISSRFADLLIYPFFLLHTVLPQLFAHHNSADVGYKQKLFSESTWILMITSLPLLLVNVFAGKWLLGYFGVEFTAGYTALVYLCFSGFLFAVFGPSNTILMMQAKEKYAALAFFVNVVLLTILNFFFIPSMGISGAALAVLISNFVYSILLAVLAWYHTGVMSPFFLYFKTQSK
jgi:O-antigen/teichoic acid export membrane protein